MPKAERENRNALPPIDIPSVVKGVLSGDEKSIRQLDGALRQRLIQFFTGKSPDQAPDLTQETVIKVFNALPQFRGEGDNYSKIFWGWIHVIAANQYFGQYRRTRRHRLAEVPLNDSMSVLSENTQENDTGCDITEETVLNVIKDKFPELLSPLELRTVEQKISGKNDEEISLAEQVAEISIRVRISRARRKIEKEILQPAGFELVSSLNERALIEAAYYRRLKTIKILGRYYTQEEDITTYRKRRTADPALIDRGYVLLAEGTTSQEYISLINSSQVLESNGRFYIKTDDLEEFRKGHKNRRRGRIFPPSPSHKRLVDLCRSHAEHGRALYAIRTGRLPTTKNGRLIFVRKEDFSAWIEGSGK